MSSEASATPASGKPDIAALTFLRPSEIKTYHRSTYDRIAPSKTLDGKGKTVLITAGATGIGFAIAESFAKSGVEHLVLIQRRQQVLDVAKTALESKYPGTKVTTYSASVTDFDHISAILKEVGKIDILVPNAAVSHPAVASKDITTADFKETFDINVVSTFHIIKEFLALDSPGRRVIICTSSASAQVVLPGHLGYGASKAAVNQMIQRFAAENVNNDVTVQTFHPGSIETESAKRITADGTADWEDVILPGDFAVWLATPEAAFLTGRYVWAQWDVDELISLKERLALNPFLLTTNIIL